MRADGSQPPGSVGPIPLHGRLTALVIELCPPR